VGHISANDRRYFDLLINSIFVPEFILESFKILADQINKTRHISNIMVNLDEETIDDLLYCARVGDKEALEAELATLSAKHNTTASNLLLAAVDENTGNGLAHYACANGHNNILSHLLAATVPSTEEASSTVITRTNKAGNTPLHYAAMNGHIDLVKSLLASLNSSANQAAQSSYLSHKNNAGHDAAYEAETANKEDVVNYLLAAMDEVDVGGDIKEGAANAEDESGMDDDGESSRVDAVAAGVNQMDVSKDP
jgi:ankyrin repeat protein